MEHSKRIGKIGVTILTCTPDITSSIFKKHSEALKAYTRDYNWLIFDNNDASNFNHAHEINKALSICTSKYLVILDDDLFVTKNWLESLLSLVDSAEVIGGIHRNENGDINHSGGYVLSGGAAGHYTGLVEKSMYVQYVCSAVMLIDIGFIKSHDLCFDEHFVKFFHETDFCLRVWESGGRVAVTSECDVIHLVGEAVENRSNRIRLYSVDSSYFIEKWIRTKKLKSLMEKIDLKLNADYNKSIKEINRLLLQYHYALKKHDLNLLKKVNKESDAFSDYNHGQQINNNSAYHISKILLNKGVR